MTGDFTAIVAAAGSASRFGGATAKQFHDLGGASVLRRSVDAVGSHPAVEGVVVVLAAAEIDGAHARSARGWDGVRQVVAGGATRAASVLNGLRVTGERPYVLVHDAARPLASPELVDAVVAATRRHGAAVPVLPVRDTVKRVEDRRVVATLTRDGLGLAQTPQGARREWLVGALERALREGDEVTDEASALEFAGRSVAAVPGEPGNLKITTPDDLESARRRLIPPATTLRVGTGYDIHRLDPERPLVLGGVPFEGEPGLAGHSDADVVLHAAMDAVLGAAGLGDVGLHFPPEEERWSGAASSALARRVAALLEAGGWRVVNLDVTVLAESPRIRPAADAMRDAIGSCLAVDPSRVGVKATTLEGLGALGRHEGIACHAVALLERG